MRRPDPGSRIAQLLFTDLPYREGYQKPPGITLSYCWMQRWKARLPGQLGIALKHELGLVASGSIADALNPSAVD